VTVAALEATAEAGAIRITILVQEAEQVDTQVQGARALKALHLQQLETVATVQAAVLVVPQPKQAGLLVAEAALAY
jgi:hypothetical protein